jgi:Fe-S-cluster-containing hydrogenase component 2
MSEMLVVDSEKCNGCGLCCIVCQCGALIMDNNKATFRIKEKCISCTHWCAVCEDICPAGAINYTFELTVEEP